MRLILSISIFCLLLCQPAYAQYSRSWNEGKLMWEDFKGADQATAEKKSDLRLQLRFFERKGTQGDTIIHRLLTACRMNPLLSWADSMHRTDNLLRYNQVLFDIGEWHRRKLQRMLDSSQYTSVAISSLKIVNIEMERVLDSVQRATDNGKARECVAAWEEIIAKELATLTPKTVMPKFYAGNFSYSIHGSIGVTVFTGGLGESFRPPVNAIAGISAGYKRILINLNTSFGFGSVVLKTIAPDNMWQKGREVKVNISDLSLGYKLIDNRTLLLVPFAGVARTAFSSRDKSSGNPPLKMAGSSLIIGLSADIKVQRVLYPLGHPILNGRHYTETCLRLKVYGTRVEFTPEVKGYTINFSLGLSSYGRVLR